jgi:hypothetical protein
LWCWSFGDWYGEFAGAEGGGVEEDLAGVADAGAIFQDAEQFLPADVRAVLFEDLSALRSHMGVEGLLGVLGGKLLH